MNKNDNLFKLRHTAEHVLHQAVKELYPQIHLAMGQATDDGFYFDFDNSPDGKEPVTLSEQDFPKIEKRMKKIIQMNLPITREEVLVDEARKMFADNPYKQEWIDEASKRGDTITIYWTGKPGEKHAMVDLCAGPHVASTGEVKAFKLLSVAGAYWRGDEKNKMLTRIYGTAFATQKELEDYINILEEAKKRDHRKLGKELGLFVFSPLVGAGLPLYTPKGTLVRRLLQLHTDELQKAIGYKEVWTPQLAKADLFKTSGHYDKYKNDMFRVVSNYSDEEYYLKPMNCPNHCVLYGSEPRSYKDLPIRYSDFANLYRDEKPGEVMGLSRLRCFSQDDGHCFCREDQIEEEFFNIVGIVQKALAVFNMKQWIRLSLWDSKKKESYLGDQNIWERSQKTLSEMLEKRKIHYTAVEGEAAIYGPKIDFMAVDSLGREWQISTIQLDLIMAKRFNLTYIDSDGIAKTPVMIHRAILGSPERLMGLLIEHYAGAFPLWLAPVQLILIPIAERHVEFARRVASQVAQAGIRVEVDYRNERMQAKIRLATLQKIPYIGIIGDSEMEKSQASNHQSQSHYISVRTREGKDLGQKKIEDFISHIINAIEKKL